MRIDEAENIALVLASEKPGWKARFGMKDVVRMMIDAEQGKKNFIASAG